MTRCSRSSSLSSTNYIKKPHVYLVRPIMVPIRASHFPFWCSVTPRNWELVFCLLLLCLRSVITTSSLDTCAAKQLHQAAHTSRHTQGLLASETYKPQHGAVGALACTAKPLSIWVHSGTLNSTYNYFTGQSQGLWLYIISIAGATCA